MQIVWLTTQFPSNSKDTKGSFIYRTVKELSFHHSITVICLHSIVPPILSMLKDLLNAKKIYRVWRSKFPRNPVPPENIGAKVIYAKYIRLPRSRFHHLEGWFGYWAVKKYIDKTRFNDSIIHATWLFPEGDLANYIYKKSKIPFVVTLMGSDVHFLKKGTKKWIKTKEIVCNASYITSVSKALYSSLEEKSIIVPETKKKLTHTIYEFNKFILKDKTETRKTLELTPQGKIIFYAGTLREIKNVNVLIEAFGMLFDMNSEYYNNLLLLIAGRGEEEGNLKKQVKSNHINSVRFLGGLSGDEMINYYNASDIFCLPSQNEGLPNVIIESLLCGTPVVASSVGEIPYIITEGKNGYLAKPGSSEELAIKLDSALKSDWDRNELRKSVSFLSPEKVLNEYRDIYSTFYTN